MYNRNQAKTGLYTSNKYSSIDDNSMNSGFEEVFNLNSFVLKQIAFNMEEWRLAQLNSEQIQPEFFDRLTNIHDCLLDLLSPKITQKEEDKYNRWIRNAEQKAINLFDKRETGLFLNRTELPKVKYVYRFIYRFLLRKLEDKGMYTKPILSPTETMGDMSD